MSLPMTGLTSNYTNNSLYWQYLAMIMQNAQQQQQAQLQNLQAMAEQRQQQIAQQQAMQAQQQTQQVQDTYTAQQPAAQTQTQPPQMPSTAKDGKDDGKISWKSKLKNFGKGIGNFFKGMVCDENGKFSWKRTLTTVGVAAGAVALTVATGGAATPFLVAAGATMGAVQVGKGAYKAATAKTDAEAEQAWQDIGSGTTAVVGSVAGAKGALKSAGVAVPKGNAVTSSLRATGECFKIAGKGMTSGAKAAVLHPMQSARNVSAYYKNTMKPNLQKAFSYKNGHKNYTEAMEQKFNKNIEKIDSQIKSLNDELATNPSASRVQEINTKLTELNAQKNVETARLNFNNGKNKAMNALEQKITEVEAKIADPATSAAEKARLSAQREQLYEMADIVDSKYKIGVNKAAKAREDYIINLKEQLKTASKDKADAIKLEIKTQESLMKGLKAQQKVEVAQHNIQKANSDITRLNWELKKVGITDAQKEAITSRIAKIEKAIVKDKQILKNANYKTAANATLPQVGLAYGSYYLGGRSAAPEGMTQEELEAYYMQQLAAEQAAQQQQYLDPNQMTAANNTNGYAQASQYNPSLFAMQPPMGTGLEFGDLYVSPYPEMIF